MEIKKVITKNNALFGFIIDDNGDEYPIIAKSLHTPIILDQLLSDGWQLFGLPYDLRKGDLVATELPKITYSEAGLDEDQEQYLMDTCVDVYKEVELKSKICKEVALAHMKFKQGTDRIKTRAELIEFLDAVEEGFDVDSELVYMPLNSFVATEALFTPAEYFSSGMSNYRRIIESRRSMSVRNHIRLIKSLRTLGLSETFDSKEFIDMYFSWGICGINFIPYDKQNKDSNLIFGQAIHHDLQDEYMPYLKERVLTYLKTDRSFYVPPTWKGSKFQTYDSDTIIEELARTNIMLGMEYITPIMIEAKAVEQVTTFISEELTVSYNAHQLIFVDENGRKVSAETYSVLAPYGNNLKVRPEMWNMLNEDTKREFFEEAYLRALETGVIENSTENIKVSSLKALRSCGVGIRPALKYMLMSDSLIDTAFETIYGEDAKAGNDEEKRVAIDNDIHDYLDGNIQPGTRKHDAVSELLENIISGSTNIDMIELSVSADQSSAFGSNYFNYLKVARKYLELSLEEIKEVVNSIHKDTEYVEFISEKGKMRMKILPRKAKRKGYLADRNKYTIKSAETATNYFYITEVYREMGPKYNTKSRHCAVKALEFYTEDGKATKQTMEWLRNLLVSEIQTNIPYRNQQKLIDSVAVMIPGIIFEILLKGTISIPKMINDKTISAPAEIRQAITNNVEEKFDSIYAFQEMAITNPKDGWFHYIVNADIIGDVVVPKKGMEIIEKPLPPVWEDSKIIPENVKKVWLEKGFIDSLDYRGYSPFYKRTSIINFEVRGGATRSALDEPLSLPSYWKWVNEYKNSFPHEYMFVAPRESYYSKLYEGLRNFEDLDLDSEDTSEELTRLNVPAKPIFGLDPVMRINRDNILQRFPELVSYFEIREALPVAKNGVRKLSNYEAEDYLYFGSFDKMNFERSFDRKLIRPFAVIGDYIHYPNERIKYTDVAHLDTEKYAVAHLRDRKYILEDIKGQLWEVII